MRAYEIGKPDIDRMVRELVEASGGGPDRDLIEQTIVTTLKLQRDHANRGELKLINSALKELRYSFRLFSDYRHVRKVSIFGSARVSASDPNYALARDFANAMVRQRKWMVITGAGPGIMTAGNRGAGPQSTFGVGIRLPFEVVPNPYIDPQRLINFKYFFTRKLVFVKESDAFVMFPGGFGTLDEAFETLTLIQTGKSDMHPVVLMEAPGTDYWETFLSFVRDDLLGNDMILEEDLDLLTLVKDVDQACSLISDFYKNFHSQRFVDGLLVLRLQRAPDDAQLAGLNQDFADIVTAGQIERIEATAPERQDDDQLALHRVALAFDRHHFGRLRSLIDRLNQF